jgi:hypothetical protein
MGHNVYSSMSAGVLSIPANGGNDGTMIGSVLESILTSLPLFSLNLGEKIGNFAMRKAQSKIEKNLPKLSSLISELNSVSPIEAKEGVEFFELIVPMIISFREKLINDSEINIEFKNSSLLFFDKFIELYERLEEISNRDFEYKASLSAISDDWNSEIDSHWDSY